MVDRVAPECAQPPTNEAPLRLVWLHRPGAAQALAVAEGPQALALVAGAANSLRHR